MRYFTLLLFLFFITCNIYSQNQFSELTEKAQSFYLKKPDSAKIYFKKALRFKTENDTLLADTYRKTGVTYIQLGNNTASKYYLEKGIETAPAGSTIQGLLYYDLAISARIKADYDRALELLDKAQNIFQSNDHKKGIAKIYGEKGTIFDHQLKSQKAVKILKKSIGLYDQLENTDEINASRQKLANTYMTKNQPEKAIKLYEIILPALKKIKSVIITTQKSIKATRFTI